MLGLLSGASERDWCKQRDPEPASLAWSHCLYSEGCCCSGAGTSEGCTPASLLSHPRALSSHPSPHSNCSPCCQLSCGYSRQSCSHCSAEQHYQGTQCNTSSLPSFLLQAFGEYLHPTDKTAIVLEAIGAMRDPCVCDEEELVSIVNVAKTEPDSWLTEVSSCGCPVLQPFQALFLPTSHLPSPRCLRHLEAISFQ